MDYASSLAALSAECDALEQDPRSCNFLRRRLHAKVSLLELDMEEDPALSAEAKACHVEVACRLVKRLGLKFVKRSRGLTTVLDLLDEIVRIFAVWLFLVDSAFVIAIPSVILDLIYPEQRLTVLAKQFVGLAVLQLSAVQLTVKGITPSTFGTDVRLLCFSHASTADAFILAAAVPVRHYSLAKAVLFGIPFFSWLLTAFGGVAINRGDKEQAIRALAAAAASARDGDCVAVAPEGTRSTTGQLLDFKKGPFHLWQSGLDSAPVIPVVFYGAFELYPPGKQMSLPGKVVMEFLEPLYHTGGSEAHEREHMSRRVRRRMLQALKIAPECVGDTAPVTLRERVPNVLAIVAIIALNSFGCRYLWSRGVSLLSFATTFSAVSMLITLPLFCFKVYLQPRLAKRKSD